MINNEIKSKMVNVVADDGKGLQLMELSEAIALAEENGEDVICLNNKSDIPVVKIMDYGKFQYEKAKKAKDNKKKAKLNAQDTKEIVISDVIAEHDLKIKAKNADRLINEGNKVKLTIRYKGRAARFINEGPEKLQLLAGFMQSKYKIEKIPKIEGNKVSMVVVPNKK